MSDRFNPALIERREGERRKKAHPEYPADNRLAERRTNSHGSPLYRFNLFSGLSEQQLDEVSKAMRIRSLKKSDIILREGELGGEMFVLLSGSIEITKHMTLYEEMETDRKDKALICLHDSYNIFFGEMTMFNPEKRSATVRALTDVKLGVLTQKNVLDLSMRDSALGFHIFRNIGEKVSNDLRRANRDILKLTTAFCLALEGK